MKQNVLFISNKTVYFNCRTWAFVPLKQNEIENKIFRKDTSTAFAFLT